MKFLAALLFTALMIFAISFSVHAAGVTLAWDAADPTDLPTGYKIYQRLDSVATYSTGADVGNARTYGVTGLKSGTKYCWVATAYDATKIESDYSNEVCAQVRQGKPILYIK